MFQHFTVGSRVVVQSLEISWHFPCNRDSIGNLYRWQIGAHKSRKKNVFEKSVIQLSIYDIKMTFPERWTRRWSLSTQTCSHKNIHRILAQILDFNRIPIVLVRIPWFSSTRAFFVRYFLLIRFICEPSVLGISFLYHKWKVVLLIF